ncbi:hypothetical protein BG015_000899, partial [Linnemannia schmuckeri]
MSETILTSLPPEIIQLIAHRLSRHSLAQCVRVCLAWHALLEPTLWQTVQFKTQHHFLNALAALTRNIHHVRQLTADSELVYYITLHLAPLNKLRSLDLNLDEEVAPFAIALASPWAAPLWNTAAPRFGNSQAVTRLLTGCTNLHSLSLGGRSCFKHVDGTDAFQEIMGSCITTSLEHLTLAFRVEDTNPCFQRIFENLGGNHDQEFALAVEQQRPLMPFVALRNLVVRSGNHHILPSKLAFLVRCPNLVRIELDFPENCILEYLPRALQEFCPNLVEMFWDSGCDYKEEYVVAMLRSSRSGWKALTLPYQLEFAPLCFNVLLECVATLEELNMANWGDVVQHNLFLDLVCSARNLRRLRGQEDGERLIIGSGVEVHAYNAFKEHIESGRDRTWALGPSMMYLQMEIVGVPRPDVVCRDNGKPLKAWMMEEGLDSIRCHDVQRWIYEQLGRMNGLEELLLGKVDVNRVDLDYYNQDGFFLLKSTSTMDIEDALESGESESHGGPHRLMNYQSLEFSLESGLEVLKGLKELRVLNVKSTAHRIGVEELDWMHTNWPKLKEIRGLVTERKWAGDGENGAK